MTLCIFCDVSEAKARPELVAQGWRYLKGKPMCPRCFGVIRTTVSGGKDLELKSAIVALGLLVTSANRLNRLVEGVANLRWEANGLRLKDTDEWADFYVRLNRTNEFVEQLEEHNVARGQSAE